MNTGENAWFKSSYSGAEGGDCIEVSWRKSSYSGAEGGECLEFAETPCAVLVRDSKHPTGPILTLGPDAWAGLIQLAVGR